MGIKKYFASKDNTISNAFEANLITRGTGSNMGAADILETFVIHGQTSASIDAANAEQSRIIIQFPIDQISADMASGVLPSSSGSMQFFLNITPKGLFQQYKHSCQIVLRKNCIYDMEKSIICGKVVMK